MIPDPLPGEPLQEAAAFESLIHKATDGSLNPEVRELIVAAAQSLHQRLAKADTLNRRLSAVSAQAAELVAELQQKNAFIATANAHAAELVAEVEIKNGQIRILNRALAVINARAAELVAENELRSQELAQANTDLSEAVEKQSKWVGFAAHDLRGGVGAIYSLSALLVEEATDGGNPDQYAIEIGSPSLKLICEESGRLLELLSTLLEAASIEHGQISLNKEPMNLCLITQGSIDLHSRAANAKNQTLVIAEATQDAWIVADPHRIRQVIDNLVSNAIKFGPPATTISIDLQKTAHELVWSVTDFGTGLTDADFAKLFHSFQKLSAVPTAGESSTGLGLALSHSIVKLHSGRIWAENRSDARGARFAFALPLNEESDATHRSK